MRTKPSHRFFAVLDDDGNVIGARQTKQDATGFPKYHEVHDAKQRQRILDGKGKWKVIRGRMVEAQQVRLDISTDWLVANNDHTVEITVRNVPTDGYPVGVAINGQHFEVTAEDQPLLLNSPVEGTWIVALDDDRYSFEDALSIRSISVDEWNKILATRENR